MNNINFKYSVLMSVYYKEKPEYLDYSIKSMLKQTIFPSEFVIVKDGELTEELNNIIEKYKQEYPNLFNIISLEQNVGLGLALKTGILNCKYEFIARMDSDDYSIPTRIEEELKIFEENSDIGLVRK